MWGFVDGTLKEYVDLPGVSGGGIQGIKSIMQ